MSVCSEAVDGTGRDPAQWAGVVVVGPDERGVEVEDECEQVG